MGPLIFTKYRDHGAYHWRQYRQGGRYWRHIERLAAWITERPVLDIGAGDGCLTARLVDAIGLDDCPDAWPLARAVGVRMVAGDAVALPFPAQTFGACAAIDVVEHVRDPVALLREARRVAPVLYVATPPARPDGRLHDRFHVTEWTPEGLVALAAAAGWTLAEPIVVGHKVQYGRFC